MHLSTLSLASLFSVLALCAALPAEAAPLAPAELKALVERLDDRQRNSGDYKTLAYIEQKERDKADVVYEAVIYRRDKDDKWMILFLKPKAEAGKGYLRIDKNLWMYDPGVGKWERRTEREKIGGTNSRREDFDESRLAEEFVAEYEGEQKLGAFDVQAIKLTVKPGIDVAYPVLRIWVDKNDNILKRQEFALSGKLMRTSYYPKWTKVYSESKKGEVWYPAEIRIFDELDKANQTYIVMKQVDLRPLEANLFTKAWLESKAR